MSIIKSSAVIEEQVLEIENSIYFSWSEIYKKLLKQIKNRHIIKLNLIKTTLSKLYFHLITLDSLDSFLNEPFSPSKIELNESMEKDLTSVIIPTGIGAAFGGYAGDANIIAKLLSLNCKYLLTHPNVVNGSVLSDPPQNMIYAEGFSLDQFLLGKINFIYPAINKIGVVFDRGIDDERLEYEINVLNASKVFYGCDFIGWTRTEKPLQVEPYINDYGFSLGKIRNIEQLIEKSLFLKSKGATAIAVCCLIPDLNTNSDYSSGIGIDPIGGVESIISRAVTSCTGLISAHAPVLVSDEKIDYKFINPVSASEYIGKSFLPSVLNGLRFAPRIVLKTYKQEQSLSCADLKNIILPANAFGIPGGFYMNELFNNVILVKENKTSLDVSYEHINMKFKLIQSYLDLLNKKDIQKLNICVEAMKRPVEKVPQA
jgi:hypothetical protein